MEGWSDCLRLEVAQHGIDVVIIEPGIIRTGFGEALSQHYSGDPDGPYGQMIRALSKATQDAYDKGQGSEPKVITNLIMQAVRAPRPKTRYVAGELARPLMIMRRVLPDRWFDRILMSQMK